MRINKGPAQDVLIALGGEELFATHQLSYILQSPSTLAEDRAAIILNASHWWFDSGRIPQILRVEKRVNMIVFIGHQFIEQTHGDSIEVLGECKFSDWIEEVDNFSKTYLSGPA